MGGVFCELFLICTVFYILQAWRKVGTTACVPCTVYLSLMGKNINELSSYSTKQQTRRTWEWGLVKTALETVLERHSSANFSSQLNISCAKGQLIEVCSKWSQGPSPLPVEILHPGNVEEKEPPAERNFLVWIFQVIVITFAGYNLLNGPDMILTRCRRKALLSIWQASGGLFVLAYVLCFRSELLGVCLPMGGRCGGCMHQCG